ncbi:MAG: hypothetical protein BWX70_00941 [Verrucomicrobia bacterium ADurb.Bin070]|jgi:hypothetical protein|nr:MAG: hypothetical protein BWX70_00941 [Verrucomicrobia bacterium ADurb.Bin070]
MTCWTITKDYLADPNARPGTNSNAVGIVGRPCGARLTAQQIIEHPDAKRFRMLDDDGEINYEGYIVGSDEFAPLDHFGEPNAGCTSIQVQENGAWVYV